MGFAALVSLVDSEADLAAVELPLVKSCTNCRFFCADFHERMPCWDCAAELPLYTKWRPDR